MELIYLYIYTLITLGFSGVFISRKNILIAIMSLEIMLLAVNLSCILHASYLDSLTGIVITIYIISVGASETAIGLSLVVAYYKSIITVKHTY